MQNIILEEIENLQGILIATTNLSTNLDKAFERRFLYKIEFGRPGEEVRKNLWISMFPGIREEDAARLAARFDFSGGQIENIVRKRYVDLVIEGREPGYDALVEYCEDELMEKVGRRVGFVG
jgi:SpoVK/Ycf46/Vps4 family AAA+-type ATPase